MIVLKQINIKAYKATHSVIIICYMDTVINVVPNADISKKHKITFFSIIPKYQLLHPKILSGYIWVW